MSKKLSELPITLTIPQDGTIVLSSAATGSKRINWQTFLNLISTTYPYIQYSNLAEASSLPIGSIIQYTGETNANYTNGYFYEKTNTGWKQKNVQSGSGGGGTGASSVSELTDVDLTGLIDKSILHYNQSSEKWDTKYIEIYNSFEDLPNWAVFSYGQILKNISSGGEGITGISAQLYCIPNNDSNEGGYFFQKFLDPELHNIIIGEEQDAYDFIKLIAQQYWEKPYQCNKLYIKNNDTSYSHPSYDATWNTYADEDYYIVFDKRNFENVSNTIISFPLLPDMDNLINLDDGFFGWMSYDFYMHVALMNECESSFESKKKENLLDFTSYYSLEESGAGGK